MSLRPAAALAALLLASCAVGPDFKRPAAPAVSGYTPEKQAPATISAAVKGGEAQRFVAGMDIPGQWWTLFHSPALDALIKEALQSNPSLEAAQATLRQAQENVLAQRGVLFPSVSGNLSTTREKISGAAFGNPKSSSIFTLTTGSLSLSYALDVFGGARRELESTEAQAEFQRYQLEAAYLTLTSNVVAAAVQEASLRAQIAATQEIIEAETQQLDVLQRQFNLGGASRAAVLAQQATLNATQATLPTLEKQLAQQRVLLTALAGRLPSEEISQSFDLAALDLPQELPLSLPSRLVEQRPDIQAAQATLHQASAQIGVATAAMLPQITLSASYGNTVTDAGQLLSGPGIWSIGAGLVQPIFKGGQLLHEKRAAEAAYDAAAAQYRNTVISAFQDVADALRALQSDAAALAAQLAAERSAADSLAISRTQYQAGAINYSTLLNAETTYQQAHINRVIAQAARFADTAALFQALGGGWWNRVDVAAQHADAAKKP
ncbi:MAG TPA: efflux transporter outer membrane subunit [Stellaceae bacterium]|jgi:NodT family efflux transporter outer membrane factor (OMF) lipoprotein|nr:efflux transporter outer membrane subunit [Stellaceae bacterium]